MAMMYTSDGWVEVKLPPFLDLDEICRKQDEEEERLWQEQKDKDKLELIPEKYSGTELSRK